MSEGDRKREIVLAALDTYECPLLRYARRLLNDEHHARDAVQHVYMKLLDADVETIEPRLAQWLFTVCRNRAMDLLRQRQRETTADPRDGHPAPRGAHGAANGVRHSVAKQGFAPDRDPAEQAEQADVHDQLRQALADLPANAREPLALWAEGFTYREIADILQQNENSLRVVVHRALIALRAHPRMQSVLA